MVRIGASKKDIGNGPLLRSGFNPRLEYCASLSRLPLGLLSFDFG